MCVRRRVLVYTLVYLSICLFNLLCAVWQNPLQSNSGHFENSCPTPPPPTLSCCWRTIGCYINSGNQTPYCVRKPCVRIQTACLEGLWNNVIGVWRMCFGMAAGLILKRSVHAVPSSSSSPLSPSLLFSSRLECVPFFIGFSLSVQLKVPSASRFRFYWNIFINREIIVKARRISLPVSQIKDKSPLVNLFKTWNLLFGDKKII